MSEKREKPRSVLRVANKIVGEISSSTTKRVLDLTIKPDVFWTVENEKPIATDEECILVRFGSRGGLRMPREKKAIDVLIEGLELAKDLV